MRIKASSIYRMWGKRALDVVTSAVGLVLFSPVLAAVAVVVRLRLGAPVLFRQSRPGLNAVCFCLVKFRTMTTTTDAQGNLLPDADRLTSLGRFLRKTSLDELPQLWNVLTGDLSLVGPRPLLIEYLDRYTPEQARRHLVKPGITGWAQVNGRNVLSWEEKFALDTWYVDHWSFWLDLRIVLLTIKSVVRREGISNTQHATMPLFTGSKSEDTQR
jgi:lipopolysaccharide/colanic/teichoic acid biosynthesis glycosyltransferase